jgi:hypothetical protein
MATSSDPPRSWAPYSTLKEIEFERRKGIEELFTDELAFIDDCLALAARQVELLGEIKPSTIEDVSVRDIGCDAFEFLYEARGALVRNQSSVMFPLMRRAFESICLCNLFVVKPEFARRWASGKQINNTDVRKGLEHHPMTESVEALKQEYQFFSQGAHPNRTHVPYVFLGEGNQFTLAGIHPIDPLTLGGHVQHLIRLCYWYVGVFFWFHRETLPVLAGDDFGREFLNLTPRRHKILMMLGKQLDTLHEETMKKPEPSGIGPSYSLDTAKEAR